MRKPNFLILFAFLCLLYFDESFGQDKSKVVYYKVDPYPVFSYKNIVSTGDACKAYFAEKVSIPKNKIEGYIFGKTYIQFIVEKDGSLSRIKVLRGVNEKLDKLAVKAVKAMPRWIPGMKNGEYVRTWYAVSVKWTVPEKDLANLHFFK